MLLEVILALVLFVGAAAVLSSGLSSSLGSLERLRLNTHAVDLAVTVVSELQLGIRTLASNGPQPIGAPLEGWSWEVLPSAEPTEADEATPFRRVEVVIRHDDPAVVYRLCQIIHLSAAPIGSSEALPGISSF